MYNPTLNFKLLRIERCLSIDQLHHCLPGVEPSTLGRAGGSRYAKHPKAKAITQLVIRPHTSTWNPLNYNFTYCKSHLCKTFRQVTLVWKQMAVILCKFYIIPRPIPTAFYINNFENQSFFITISFYNLQFCTRGPHLFLFGPKFRFQVFLNALYLPTPESRFHIGAIVVTLDLSL